MHNMHAMRIGDLNITQVELAARMDTTQGAIARLESGASMPSTRRLRKLAAATGHKLMISFESQPG